MDEGGVEVKAPLLPQGNKEEEEEEEEGEEGEEEAITTTARLCVSLTASPDDDPTAHRSQVTFPSP